MPDTQALTYIEIDVDRCSLTYGNSPCTASIPTTGDRKCFNSLGTCQDRDNFDNDPVTIRFAIDAAYLPDDIECIPCLVSVDFSPSIVSLGVDLGQRASLKVVCKDHPDSDTGPHGDPYLADRAYNPFAQGTFFGKFRARNPYLRGRNLRLIRGVVGQALGAMETRHFIVESFDGPLPDGSFSITAKDVLKLADGDRAQAPVLSNGYLQAGIDDNDMAITLSPTGIGDAEYPASGTAAIGGKEIVTFTRSGDAVTITARAQFNTEAVAHDAQDRFQLCLVYDGEDPADIVADLLENYAGVDAAYIPIADWLAETDAYLQRLYTACIPEPTAVSTLLKELIEQAALALAWDDEAQKIRLQVLRGILTDVQRFTEDNCIEGTIQPKEQPSRRISRGQVYFGQINPLRPVDEPDNYKCSASDFDAVTEANDGIAIKTIYSRWIPENGRSTAERLIATLIARYKVPPRRIAFDLWRDGQYEPILLQGGRVEGWFIQDDTGAPSDEPVQIIRVNPLPERYQVEAEGMRFDVPDDFNDRIVTIEVSTLNFNARNAYDELFPAPDTGTEIIFRLLSGAIVGSVSTASPSFVVGDWPTDAATGNRTSGSPILTGLSIDTAQLAVGMTVAGTGIPAGSKILTIDSSDQITLDDDATSGSGTSTTLTIYLVLITIEIEGRAQGAGGAGGTGAGYNFSGGFTVPGTAGAPGGTAFYTRYPVTITGGGEVFGGGGGGGGGGSDNNSNFYGSPGGGGGRGSNPGAVGPSGSGTNLAPLGTAATTEVPGGAGLRISPAGDAGAGGDAGQAGAGGTNSNGGGGGDQPGTAGGAGGNAIDGDSFITEAGSLTIAGARVN